MEKLIKYEFRGTFKLFGAAVVIAILVYTIVFFQINNVRAEFILVFTFMTTTALYMALLIFSINAFYKDLYDDQGYLIYTLPLKAKEIVGAKLMVSLLWFLVAYVISSTTGDFALRIFNVSFGSNMLHEQKSWIVIGSQIFIYAFGICLFLLMNYFSIIISKITIREKKAGGVFGFICTILLLICYGYSIIKLSKIFPQMMVLGEKAVGNDKPIMRLFDFLEIYSRSFHINIVVGVFHIVVFGLLFAVISYLADHRISI